MKHKNYLHFIRLIHFKEVLWWNVFSLRNKSTWKCLSTGLTICMLNVSEPQKLGFESKSNQSWVTSLFYFFRSQNISFLTCVCDKLGSVVNRATVSVECHQCPLNLFLLISQRVLDAQHQIFKKQVSILESLHVDSFTSSCNVWLPINPRSISLHKYVLCASWKYKSVSR